MRFKNPGGELSWLTPLMFLGGAFMAFYYYQQGSTALAILSGSIGLLSLLVWLDMKWVALPLIGWFSLVLVAGVAVLCLKEFSWRLALRLCAVGFTIYALWEWYRRRDPDDVDPEMEELERLSTSHVRRDDALADDVPPFHGRDALDDSRQRLDDARQN
jgi:hypothetical protein